VRVARKRAGDERGVDDRGGNRGDEKETWWVKQ
jgi:hypothetical protein